MTRFRRSIAELFMLTSESLSQIGFRDRRLSNSSQTVFFVLGDPFYQQLSPSTSCTARFRIASIAAARVDLILPCSERDRQGVLGECIVARNRVLSSVRSGSPNGCIDFQGASDCSKSKIPSKGDGGSRFNRAQSGGRSQQVRRSPWSSLSRFDSSDIENRRTRKGWS